MRGIRAMRATIQAAALLATVALLSACDSTAPDAGPINISGTYHAVSFDGGPLEDSYLGEAQCFPDAPTVPTRLDRMTITFHDHQPDPEERDDLSGLLAERYECGRLNNELRWPVPGSYWATTDSLLLRGSRFPDARVAWDGGTDRFEVEVLFPGGVSAVVGFRRE